MRKPKGKRLSKSALYFDKQMREHLDCGPEDSVIIVPNNDCGITIYKEKNSEQNH